MNTIPFPRVSSIVVAVCTCGLSGASAQSTNPSVPFGKLTASPTMVQAGTKPDLTWNITYPLSVKDVVTVSTPPGITPKQDLICDVRMIGAGVTTKNARGTTIYVQTLGQILYNGSSSWSTIFNGFNTDRIVQQQGIVISFTANANKPINFGGYYITNNVSSVTYTSRIGDNVRFQFNGDTPPANLPGYNSPSLAGFVKPYLDASGRIKIGPMDVIVFMELTTANKATLGYDLQDLVMLVTFRNP
ncbi:MAG: hypothetical protein WCK77_12290 [Verrucomicrobiota bacterium]